MKHFILVILSILAFLQTEYVSAQIYTSQAAQISFFSSARMEDIEATSKKAGVVLNTSTKEVMFKVLITSFVFKNGLMQEHFNETYMESDKYPYAEFKGKINEAVDLTKAGTYNVTVTGTLTIHGIAVPRTISGVVTVAAGTVTITADFMVPVSAHKIDIPKDKISNIAQDIKVSVQADCIPYVKK